jgi:hypothetical protein
VETESVWEDQDHAEPSRSRTLNSKSTSTKKGKETKKSPKSREETQKPDPHPSVLLDTTPTSIPSTKPHLLNLAYKFNPRINSGTFLLHAAYIFTNPSPTKTNLLLPLQSQSFRFCPHITSSQNSKGGQILPDTLFSQLFIRSSKDRPKIDEMLTYKESCSYCSTDYQVSVCLRMVGVPRVVRVEFEFWYELGDGKGDGKWDYFRPRAERDEGNEECIGLGEDFVKGRVRKKWEEAEISSYGHVDDSDLDEPMGWWGTS